MLQERKDMLWEDMIMIICLGGTWAQLLVSRHQFLILRESFSPSSISGSSGFGSGFFVCEGSEVGELDRESCFLFLASWGSLRSHVPGVVLFVELALDEMESLRSFLGDLRLFVGGRVLVRCNQPPPPPLRRCFGGSGRRNIGSFSSLATGRRPTSESADTSAIMFPSSPILAK